MTSRISHTSFDAINAYKQSLFWSQVLDFVEDPEDPNLPEHEECLITSRDGSQLLLFITVPDTKQVKNRVHLDLRPADRSREDEVERVIGLGAKFFADFRRPDGSGWITLTDPEGNEFCILSATPPVLAPQLDHGARHWSAGWGGELAHPRSDAHLSPPHLRSLHAAKTERRLSPADGTCRVQQILPRETAGTGATT